MPKPGIMYVPSHVNLGTHPKTRKLARRLETTVVTTVGHLHFLWWWGMSYAPDGCLDGFTAEDIAIAGEWEGDPDQFVTALTDTGFITEGRLHDWDDYGGQLFREREKSRERQQRYRDASLRNGDVTVTSRPVTVTPIGEERRGEERKEKKPTVSERKRENYSPEFSGFWNQYPAGNGSKIQSYAQWQKIAPDDYADVLTGLVAWKASERWQEGYVKACDIWLRDRWWEQLPPPPKSRSPGTNGSKPDMFAIARNLREQEAV